MQTLVTILVTAIITLTFPTADLVFAFEQPSSCQHVRFNNFHLTLYNWLLIDAFVQLTFVVPLFLAVMFCREHGFLKSLLIKVVNPMQHLFVFVWTIVGCVLFWHFLLPRNCSDGVQQYMWVRLITGLISTVHHQKVIH